MLMNRPVSTTPTQQRIKRIIEVQPPKIRRESRIIGSREANILSSTG
jgi:hypothetical protein